MPKIVLIFTITTLIMSVMSAPYQNSYGNRNEINPDQKIKRGLYAQQQQKKDMFISRGWGAGGMPFSVLYMNPSFSSSKAPATVETHNNHHHQQRQNSNVSTNRQQNSPSKSQQHYNNKSLPQVRTSMRQKSLNRSPHSVIPQLFVSYGWGPLGKK